MAALNDVTPAKDTTLVQGHTLMPRAPADSCNNINSCRTLFDIVWGCLSTIFACTWVSVHPNVPEPDQCWLALLWRRLRMMLVAIIAPELIVGFAARQFFAARWFSKKFGFSRTHGFFLSMGGFVSRLGRPIASIEQLDDPLLGPGYLSDIHKIKVSDIMDKSKGDALSKGVALAQGLWFTTVATLAFAVVNVFTWLFWWGKPLDVQQPIPVGHAEQPQEATGPMTRQLDLLDRFLGALLGGYSEYNPAVSTSVPSFWSTPTPDDSDDALAAFFLECLVASAFGAIHCTAWRVDFPSADEMWMWRACSLFVTAIPVIIASIVALMLVHKKTTPYEAIFLGTLIVGLPMYIVARLFLIVLPFTTSRALPPGAFTEVNWSVYMPHL
ncbi:hypothetical protein FB451DRAFT_1285150 [Mycena latifolia]|nr:hypothetical protein FB451DRAFT_1285150 [Mycena latifolia]